ncbi:unnamed protein product [Choristocarpus tenellus]
MDTIMSRVGAFLTHIRTLDVFVGCLTILAFIWLVKSWWKGDPNNSRDVQQPKLLSHSPGISVVRVAADGTNTNGNIGRKYGAKSKWEKSKEKGSLGYYFAHHTSTKEVASHEYQMNQPKLLSKTSEDASLLVGGEAAGAKGVGVTKPKAKAITKYSWEDCGKEIRLSVRQEGWDWGAVDVGEISVEWAPLRLRLVIASKDYGLHALDLPRLNKGVKDVRVRKMRKKLVLGFEKIEWGLWHDLQAPLEPESTS